MLGERALSGETEQRGQAEELHVQLEGPFLLLGRPHGHSGSR